MAKPKIQPELNMLAAEFRLNYARNSSLLSDWLTVKEARLDDLAEAVLGKVESLLYAGTRGWLEGDIKMKLLSPIFLLSEIDEAKQISTFFGRRIVAETENFRINLIADCLVASVYGLTTPKTPYFFMQEFKRSKYGKQDPQAEMLAAMIAAQYLKQDGKPIYGSYLLHESWYFTILEGRNYACSNGFQLTQPEKLRQVILTLRKLKQIILYELMD